MKRIALEFLYSAIKIAPYLTVVVDSFVFKQTVFVGGLASFYANIIKIGRTSITADVLVYTQCENGKKSLYLSG